MCQVSQMCPKGKQPLILTTAEVSHLGRLVIIKYTCKKNNTYVSRNKTVEKDNFQESIL